MFVENVIFKNVVIEKVDLIYLLKNIKNFNFINIYINEKKVELIKKLN